MKCKYCGTKLGKGIEVCPKCGRIYKNPFGGKGTKIAIIAVAAIVALSVIVGGAFALTSLKDDMDVKVIDEAAGEYMLVNAPTKIKFDVELTDGSVDDIVVEDIYGGTVKSRIEGDANTAVIKAPEGGYEKGEIYTIDLKDIGTFRNKEFDGAKKVTFVIEKKNTTSVEFKDDVIELKDEEAKLDNDQIILEGDYSEGDIVVADTDGDGIQEAYKLSAASSDGDETTASYEIATADEVYEELDIFYYDKVDLSNAEINEEVVTAMVEESGIIETFTDEVYAAEKVITEVEFDYEEEFKITLTDPDNEDRQLILTFTLEDAALFKCTTKVALFDNTITIGSEIELTIKGEADGETEKNIREAIEKYIAKKGKMDKSSFDEDFITVPIPIAGVAGLEFGFGTKAFFAASAEFNAKAGAEVSLNQGIIFDIKKLKVKDTYADITGDINAEMMVKGQLEAFAGLTMEGGGTVMSLIDLKLQVEGGPYLEGQGCFIVKDMPEDLNTDGYYKIDIGLRVAANAVIDYVIDQEELELAELKKPVLQYSHYLKVEDLSLKDSYFLAEDGIDIGDLEVEYYDKIEGENIDETIEKYTLYIDGKKVKVSDGVIKKDLKEGTYTFKVEWKYEGQKFSEEREVEITDFDPWGYFERFGLINTTYKEIEERYGEYEYIGAAEGGFYYRPVSLSIDVVFSGADVDYSTVDLDYGNPDYFIPRNAPCVAVSGYAQEMFGIKEMISMSDLENAFNLDMPFYFSPEDEAGEFYGWYGVKDSITIYICSDDQYCHSDDLCQVNAYHKIKGE